MQPKVKLKDNQAHCDRCGGYGTFFVRVLNNTGVPASPAQGMCYRCKGNGIDPHITREMQIKWEIERHERVKALADAKNENTTFFFTEQQKSTIRKVFEQLYKREKDGQFQYTVGELAGQFAVPHDKMQRIFDALVSLGYISKTSDSGLTWYDNTATGIERFEAHINLGA